jgi:acyl phosphate:glycerol-3-phosphate acyltransferase
MHSLPASPLNIAIVLLAAYLAGSIPFSLWVGRVIGGIDLRQHGSGNVGATNVARLLGWKWGVAALLLDALKGLAPTGILPRLFADPAVANHVAVGCGLAAIIGHMFPCWLGFRGGKGVATSLGVVLMLAPWAALMAAGVFAVCFAIWRFVSLGSIVAAITFAVVQFLLLRPSPFSAATWSLAIFSIAVPLLVIIRHRSNIGRLIRGEEKSFAVKRDSREPEKPPHQ